MEKNIIVRTCELTAQTNVIPQKSKERYEDAYKKFTAWCTKNNVETLDEGVLLEFFREAAETQQVSTLWTRYSMLKAQLLNNKNVDISKYSLVISYLKRLKDGYQPRKSERFNKSHFDAFLKLAPDGDYLLMKTILIMGVYGACRRNELAYLNTTDVKILNELLVMTISDPTNNTERHCVINNLEYIEIIKKYYALRPENVGNNRFFLYYRNNRCTKQPIGVNTIGFIPKKIADFLKLKNPQNYTGHCFRKSSAIILGTKSFDSLNVKKHEEFKPSNETEEDSSWHNDIVIAGVTSSMSSADCNKFNNPNRASADIDEESLSHSDVLSDVFPKMESDNLSPIPQEENTEFNLEPKVEAGKAGITLYNCQHITFNLNIYS